MIPRNAAIKLLVGFLFVCWSIRAWNGGPIVLDAIKPHYIGKAPFCTSSKPVIIFDGVTEMKRWIETKTRPEWNPFVIVWQHIWYNCFTTGYDLVFWLEPGSFTGERIYGMYLSGQTLFLRVEFDGFNRVLKTDFNAKDVEVLLKGYLGNLNAEAPVIGK